MQKGLFITFEGGEGCGKSTQARLLADFFEAQGREVVLTREPGGSDGAEDIRALVVKGDVARWDALTEALLMYAARRDHLVKKIIPALNDGKVVICDRFADSTAAYQGYAYGEKALGKETSDALYRMVVGPVRPDLTLMMDMPVETGLERALKRDANVNRYERMGLGFHNRLREAFLKIARNEPERCAVINAARTIPEIRDEILNIVRERLLR